MQSLIIIFFIAILSTVVLTPAAARIGRRFGAIDQPGSRKVHTRPCPRTGGIALYLTFLLIIGLSLFTPLIAPWFEANTSFLLLLCGLSIVFGIGLLDDFAQLNCILKLVFQCLGASLAYFSGLQIDHFYLPNLQLEFGPLLSYSLTIIWFLLFINAVNLIDGLDGLASGITFFAASVMTITLVWRADLQGAAWFAIISGSCLGFLRYNFNPAKIFLGDGGSYFLGFSMAAFSILADFKSQMGASLLIPIIGMGIPIMDAIVSPVRRFLLGKGIFQPDDDHIHHRLLTKGLSTNQAIWVLYCITFILCLFALYLVHLRDERSVFLLLIMGVAVIFFIIKLGYFSYIKREGLSSWLHDLSYEAGLNQDRRSFVHINNTISKSTDLATMWSNTIIALDLFEFDLGELVIFENHDQAEIKERYIWTKDSQSYTQIINLPGTMKLEMPLIGKNSRVLGMLWLIKDMHNTNMSHYTLRRVEHLRRSVLKTVQGLQA